MPRRVREQTRFRTHRTRAGQIAFTDRLSVISNSLHGRGSFDQPPPLQIDNISSGPVGTKDRALLRCSSSRRAVKDHSQTRIGAIVELANLGRKQWLVEPETLPRAASHVLEEQEQILAFDMLGDAHDA